MLAQAFVYVDLDNVARIVDRVITTLDRNPRLLTQLLTTVDSVVGTVGGVANTALQPGGVVSQTVGTVGQVANTALAPGGNEALVLYGIPTLSPHALPAICAVFILYALYGRNLPGLLAHRGYGPDQVIDQLFLGTVRQDVAFGPANLGVTASELDERVYHELLERPGVTLDELGRATGLTRARLRSRLPSDPEPGPSSSTIRTIRLVASIPVRRWRISRICSVRIRGSHWMSRVSPMSVETTVWVE